MLSPILALAVNWQTLLGIGVTIGLWILADRKTVGAAQQRVGRANDEVLTTLIKRVVLENYEPSLHAVAKLIEGKAIQHKVAVSSLLGGTQVLNLAYAQVLESDFIAPETRAPILTRITTALESDHSPETGQDGKAGTARFVRKQYVVGAGVGALGVAVGVSTILASIADSSQPVPIDTGTAIGLALAGSALYAGAILQHRRRLQESGQKKTPARQADDFERSVLSIITAAKVTYKRSEELQGASGSSLKPVFLVYLGGKEYVIQTSWWPKFQVSAAWQLARAMKELKADGGILIVREKMNPPRDVDSAVRIMDSDEFAQFLSLAVSK